ncbi:uncharacterized protein LOC143031311 [Oratosquilla oratoria]|uniref:uncharacterized protein LOC143031311 n=1 Tax=Oratosquilla oratoria TaxID=337810 RepID=UPI003F769123
MKMWHYALAVFCLVAVVSAGTFPHNHGGHVVGGGHHVVGGGHEVGGGGHVGGHPGVFPGRPCKNYCKNEYSNKYECCDHIRPGQCPPVRSVCPLSDTFQPPNPCFNDDDCYGEQDKCCFDTCLGHKTCKPIQPTYG